MNRRNCLKCPFFYMDRFPTPKTKIHLVNPNSHNNGAVNANGMWVNVIMEIWSRANFQPLWLCAKKQLNGLSFTLRRGIIDYWRRYSDWRNDSLWLPIFWPRRGIIVSWLFPSRRMSKRRLRWLSREGTRWRMSNDRSICTSDWSFWYTIEVRCLVK